MTGTVWAVYKIFKKCMMLQVKHLGEMAPDIDEKSAQRRERMLVALRNKYAVIAALHLDI